MPYVIKIPQKTVLLWQIRTAVIFGVIIALSLYLCFISLWFLILTSVTCILLLFSVFFFIPHHILSYKITVSEKAIVVKRGFIIKSEYIMPFVRMIYASSYSFPFSRKYCLSGLVLHAARGFLIIPEIKSEDAAVLIGYIEGNYEKNE